MSKFSPPLQYAVASAILALFCIVWLGAVIHAGWRADDGPHLDFAQHLSAWQYFLIPEITRAQSGVNVTPWNALFYDINIALFGEIRSLHYAHLLFIIYLTSVAAFALAKHYAGYFPSLIAAIIFLSGISTFRVSNQLMTGHYAYGLIFSALATLAFLRYQSSRSLLLLIAAVAAYIAACSCKEVYTPLPLILFMLANGSIRQRLVSITPFAIIAIFYLIWRIIVLGTIVSGHSDEILMVEDSLGTMMKLPLLFSASADWGHLRPVLLAMSLLVGAGLMITKGLRGVGILLSGIVAVALPLGFLNLVALDTANRYLYVAWFLFSLMLGLVISKAPFGKLGQIVLAGILTAVAASSTLADKPKFYAEVSASERFYDAIDKLDSDEWLVPPDSRYLNHYTEFAFANARLKNKFYRNDFLVTSTYALCREISNGAKFLSFDRASRRFQERSLRTLWLDVKTLEGQKGACFEGKKRQERPISIEMSFADGFLSWEFGPYQNGKYSYFLDSSTECHEVGRSGRYPLASRKLKIQVMYESPEGWVSLSPEVEFDPSKSNKLSWSGVGQKDAYPEGGDDCVLKLGGQSVGREYGG